MRRGFFVFLLALIVSGAGLSQESKPPLDFTVYDTWKSLSSYKMTDDGKWLTYEINPSVGDGEMFVRSLITNKEVSFQRGDAAVFSPNNDFIAFKIKVYADTVRQNKIDKVKKDKLPKDSLVIYFPETNETKKWANLKSFKVPNEGASILAYMLEEKKKVEEKDSTDQKVEKAEVEPGAEKEGEKTNQTKANDSKSKKKDYEGSKLTVLDTKTNKEKIYEHVTEYSFARKGSGMIITSIEEDSINTSRIYYLDTESGDSIKIWDRVGVAKKITTDEDMTQFAFLHSEDTAKTKVYSLYFWKPKMEVAELLVDSLTTGMSEGYVVSEKGSLRFSVDGKMLFLGTGEKPEMEEEDGEKKDSLLAEDKVQIDIWHWQDPVLQSMQLKRISRTKNKSYQAVVLLKDKIFHQLGKDGFVENYRFANLGETMIGLGLDSKPYELSNAVNFESFKDIYLLNLESGQKEKIYDGVSFSPALSPHGKFLYWWEPQDSNYYAYSIEEKSLTNLTPDIGKILAIDNNDNPDDTRSYGSMGWTKDDEAFYVYDKFDIWKLDPTGMASAKCISENYGKENKISFRYTRTNPDEKFLDENTSYYFLAFNTENKQSGYYRMKLKKGDPAQLIMGDFRIGRIVKAKDARKLLWTKSTVEEYGEIHVSSTDFSEAEKLTCTNPQQNDYNWMTCELVDWLDYDGVKHQGLLYKPENFDPNKKYPMMVYFYRLHSDGLHRHITPRASSSTINAAFYASNGYLVFMPDVFFKIGHPGKSAFNSIVSGVMSLGKEKSYIDMKKLALQGQSWGGYQAAYIITQTDLFAAASPGAPVSNMTSAYGGIRTSSGMCRQVQYEKGQSRIGGTLWEKPVEYFENSPLFYAHQCNTPCLIRHNDNDGAVPFAQGVEFFVALRRLGKPSWLLNYNKGPHNLTQKLSNRKDLSVRMKQFFDHYLMDKSAPEWLVDGVKAVDKKESETYYLDYTK